MRKTGLLALALIAAMAGTAAAHEGEGGNFGIGVGLGAPTALTLEVAPTPPSGLELAIGFDMIDRNDVYGHLVFKHNIVHLARGYTVWVPLYLGLGGFVREFGDVTDFGARAPMGVNFDFQRAPIQLFGEVALEAVLVSDRDHDPLGIAGFAGMRVWM